MLFIWHFISKCFHLCQYGVKSGKFQPVAKEVKSMLTFPTWASLSFIATRYSRTSICDNESYVPRFLYVLFSLKRIYARDRRHTNTYRNP